LNKTSKLYKELSSDELDKIIDKHFDETNLYKATLLSGGLFNTTYHILFTASKKEVILRVGPVNRDLLLPFEHHLMHAEEYVYQRMNEYNIPCSQVLVCDTSKSLIDRDYMIVSCITSKPLSELDLSEAMKEKLYHQVGRYTAKIHKITNAQFGRVSEILDGNGYSSWREYLQKEVATIGSKLMSSAIFTSDEVELCKQVLTKYEAILNEIQVPYLVHADLWVGNVLVRKLGEDYEVAAIIDADRAIFGDLDYEFASPWIINDAFLKGYGEIKQPSTNATIRKKIYRLIYSLTDAYVWGVEYDNPLNCKNNKESSLQIVQELLM
jgi:fructosamine-3-kinase